VRLASRKSEAIKAWVAAVLWLIVIAIESTSYLSSQNTSRILYPILHFIFGMNWERFDYWHFYIRKTGHVIGYGTLSVLLFRALRATAPGATDPGAVKPRWTARWSVFAVLGTAVVASLDEWHQTFIPSRTGTIRDVILDTAAGIAVQILLFFVITFLSRKTPATN
jgi:VanZ family protein